MTPDFFTRRPRPRGATARGIMLVEVLLAMAITGMVAAAVASLLFVTANGSRDRDDLRRRNVRSDVLAGRVDGAIRASSVLLGRDANCLVLWVADSRKNEKPDLSELRRIEWDAATKELRCYAAPAAGLADADNPTYGLGDDFLALTAALRGSATFPGETWGYNVTAWDSTTSGGATLQLTRLIGDGLTIETAAGAYSFRSAVSLRGTAGMEGYN